jgi:hypothetical protein
VIAREEVAWQVNPVGKDNLQAPELTCYISIYIYIFK